jgi:hypothetical protein
VSLVRPSLHEPTRAWLADRGIPAWQWKNQRKEATTTSAIRGLLDPDKDLTLALIIRDALLAGADKRRVAQVIGQTPLWGYESGARATPDLGMIDATNQIRVVIEHKRGAAPHPGRYPHFNTLTRFNEPLALSLPARLTDGENVLVGPWGYGKLWQIDYYRCTNDWIRALETGHPVTLPDATKALWILLDSKGRDARELYWEGHTSAEWTTTSYGQFVPPIISAYDDALENGLTARANQIEGLLRMLGS